MRMQATYLNLISVTIFTVTYVATPLPGNTSQFSFYNSFIYVTGPAKINHVASCINFFNFVLS